MSYLVLARKYRPQVFAEMVGQSHLTHTLANAISGDRVAHAYLFCGPRGVGKTTAARILAKALNCERGPAPVPCNECDACREIIEGRSLDVLEIDGASNRGIEEVRELRENTRYAPARGRFKVYIIDEAHMLTKEAFNALLKTLEEPPAHVVFVLATTEPFKMPDTILSRCQRFDFARIPAREIAGHLSSILDTEGIHATPEALSLVARRARGGVRDALSLLDQIISAADGDIDVPAVERILGLVGSEFYYALVDRLAEEDMGGALQLLDMTYAEGADLGELADGLAAHLRDLMLVGIDAELGSLVDAPESEVPRLRAQAEKFSRETLLELVDRAVETGGSLRRAEHPRLAMEITLAEMAQAAGRVPLGELAKRLLDLEQRMGGGDALPPSGGAGSAPKPAAPKKPTRSRSQGSSKSERSTAAPEAGPGPAYWQACLEGIKERSMGLWTTLQAAEVAGAAGDGTLVLRSPNQLVAKALRDAESQELLCRTLAEVGRKVPRVVPEGEVPVATRPGDPAARSTETAAETEADTTGESPGPEIQPDAVVPPGPSPEQQDGTGDDKRTMGQLFKDEPMLQRALDIFDGEVLP